MRFINPGYIILDDISYGGIYELERVEKAARTCYRSENKILEQAESAKKLIKNLIDRGHEAMLEHSSLCVEFTCDRGVANEIVRHRLASFAQESTRYCNYASDKFDHEIGVILPNFEDKYSELLWRVAVSSCEKAYLHMIEHGETPQMARGVLPLSLATKIVVTANYREWRHILKLRTAKDAHPQIREIMVPLLKELKERIPIIFDDITVEEE